MLIAEVRFPDFVGQTPAFHSWVHHAERDHNRPSGYYEPGFTGAHPHHGDVLALGHKNLFASADLLAVLRVWHSAVPQK